VRVYGRAPNRPGASCVVKRRTDRWVTIVVFDDNIDITLNENVDRPAAPCTEFRLYVVQTTRRYRKLHPIGAAAAAAAAAAIGDEDGNDVCVCAHAAAVTSSRPPLHSEPVGCSRRRPRLVAVFTLTAFIDRDTRKWTDGRTDERANG
jgi:hypothetical protein